MHSHIGPTREASEIYVQPSRLHDRAQDSQRRGESLVLYDVGMGTGANALAALAAYPTAPARPLHLLSIEPCLDAARAALAQADLFPFLQGQTDVFRTLLEQGRWESPDLSRRWELYPTRLEDLPETLPRPELVYYDMHSPKVAPELWSRDAFARFRACSLLITYSAATRVRVALSEAGLEVGLGPGTAAKRETTHASGTGAILHPLDREWFARKARLAYK